MGWHKRFSEAPQKFGCQGYSMSFFHCAQSLVGPAGNKISTHIIITDARRSFPFAQRIQRKTGAKVVTVFHDPDVDNKKRGRDTQTLAKGSNVWITPEKRIYEALKKKCGLANILDFTANYQDDPSDVPSFI